VLRSEWTKVRSVRSTPWTLGLAFAISVGLSALICTFVTDQFQNMPSGERAGFDPTQTSFAGMRIGQLAMIAFGVLVVSGEYSTGMIRSSLAAVPQRRTFLWCKLAVATALVLVVGMATSFVSFFLGQALLGDHGTDIGQPHVLRAVVGGGLYMTLMGLFAMGITFVLRSPLLAFSILMPFFFIISGILNTVDATEKFARYLPDQAGARIMSVVGDDSVPYGPWGGLGIMFAWVVAALIAGAVVLESRDA
jgi:ABC-type transport system involved in multi-copper enzyme maturation permease subunit